ncbi:membrane protein [Mycoplasmatota bacterium WC44]
MLLNDFKKIPKLLFSFAIFAFGMTLIRLSRLGLIPWGVFHDGLSKTTGITFGSIIQITGVIILILTLFIKIYPGLGTVLSIIFIGMFIDIFESLNLVPYSELMRFKFLYYGIGLILMSLGMALYISCRMGAGARDGLLIGIVRITKLNIRYIKPIIELIVMFIGFLFGGTIGIGTVVGVLLSGYFVDKFFILLKYDPHTSNHSNFLDYIKTNSLN